MDLVARVRSSFVAGLLLVAPLAVTLFVLQFVFTRLTGLIRPLVVQLRPIISETLGADDVTLVAQLFAALTVVAVITGLGYLASISLGQRLFGGFERGLRLVPLVRTVYFGVRQVSESLTERADGYESVVLVEFPRRGSYSIGFVTNEAPGATRDATGEELYTVFVPNSPNPTAGALVMLPETDVHEVDMSVRRGIRLLVTTGLSADDETDVPAGTVIHDEHDRGVPSADGGGEPDTDPRSSLD
jgi:uncharacterized membrane protein